MVQKTVIKLSFSQLFFSINIFIFSFSKNHKFSIGLRSRELGGHSSFPLKLSWWSWSLWRLVAAVCQQDSSCTNVILDFILEHFLWVIGLAETPRSIINVCVYIKTCLVTENIKIIHQLFADRLHFFYQFIAKTVWCVTFFTPYINYDC